MRADYLNQGGNINIVKHFRNDIDNSPCNRDVNEAMNDAIRNEIEGRCLSNKEELEGWLIQQLQDALLTIVSEPYK